MPPVPIDISIVYASELIKYAACGEFGRFAQSIGNSVHLLCAFPCAAAPAHSGFAVGIPRAIRRRSPKREKVSDVPDISSGDTMVTVRLNQQQLELVDRTIAQGVAPDRAALIRLALREQASLSLPAATAGAGR